MDSTFTKSNSPTSPPGDSPWFRFYDKDVPHRFEPEEAPLYAWLDRAAESHPHSKACHYHNNAISYAKLREQAEIMAANLNAHGLEPGDRVGIMLPNLPQTMIAFWGVLKAGGVVTMINPLYMETELLHQVKDAGIKIMISYDGCWEKFAKLRKKLRIDRYFITTVADGLAFPANLVQRFKARRNGTAKKVPYDGKTVFSFSGLLKGRKRLSVPVADPKKTLALLQYTGGTTGLSKGAMLSHYNAASNAQQTEAVLQYLHEEDQVFIGVLPFFHVYGLNTCLVLPTLFHAAVVPVTRFSPTELLTTMKKRKGTVLPGAPAMYISLLQQKNKNQFSLESLKVCVAGSAPMPVEMLRRFEEAFTARICEGYGLSESSPITHINPALGIRKAGSIGLPLPGTEARIVDMELGSVPLGPEKIGELVVRGPQVMSGYWGNPDETANALRNGWLYTGDIAYMDEDGFFFIVDRKKDMIIVGGYNVSPREIDEVLYEHPKVREAVTVGVEHPSRGEVIKAYVVLREGEVCDKAEIVRWCRERLANYKVPRMVEFRDELPKTLVGKILRRTLRAEEAELRKKRMENGTSADYDAEHVLDHDAGERENKEA
jgi:Acyl-CoA synthetases (AMP-forming)/AMP-acid ligases II